MINLFKYTFHIIFLIKLFYLYIFLLKIIQELNKVQLQNKVLAVNFFLLGKFFF